MKLTKFAVALALFLTTVNIDKQLVSQPDGTLTASWNVSVQMNWGMSMEMMH